MVTAASKHKLQNAVFHGRCRALLIDDDDEINQLIDESFEKIFNSISKFTRGGSVWTGHFD